MQEQTQDGEIIFAKERHDRALRYEDFDAANAIANELNRESRRTWRAAFCRECSGYHITSDEQFVTRGN